MHARQEDPKFQQILAQAGDLPRADKVRLVESLSAQLREDDSQAKHHSVVEFRGIGYATWDGTDAQEYVNMERASWDG